MPDRRRHVTYVLLMHKKDLAPNPNTRFENFDAVRASTTTTDVQLLWQSTPFSWFVFFIIIIDTATASHCCIAPQKTIFACWTIFVFFTVN